VCFCVKLKLDNVENCQKHLFLYCFLEYGELIVWCIVADLVESLHEIRGVNGYYYLLESSTFFRVIV